MYEQIKNFIKEISNQIKNMDWGYSMSIIINAIIFILLTPILIKNHLLNWYTIIFYFLLFIGSTSFIAHLEEWCIKYCNNIAQKNNAILELKNLSNKEQFLLEKFVRWNVTTIKFKTKEELSDLKTLNNKLGFLKIFEQDKRVIISAKILQLLKKHLKLINRPNTVTITPR